MWCRVPGMAGEMRFVLLTRWTERAKGLLGTGGDAEAVALVPCASVHTFGMRYALDIAFLSKDGRVLRSERKVPPGKVMGALGAHYALERPSSGEAWLSSGSLVDITEIPCGV